MKIVKIILFSISAIMAGCISNRVIVPEVSSTAGESTIIGSRTMHNGARVDAYVVAVDGKNVDPKKGYKTQLVLAPGEHEITIETVQCRKAKHTFSVVLNPNSVYVVQGITVDYNTHKIWISEKEKQELLVEPVLSKKSGSCSVVVFG